MEEEITKFSETLKKLTTNDKYVINTLSEIAMRVKDSQQLSKDIAKLSIGNIFKSQGRMKLVSFYVVDSIIKNVGTPYKEMFSQIIVQAFLHTFQANKDHDIRIKLYNLRITWKQYFSPTLMNDLDKQVKKYDPAWPILLEASANKVDKPTGNSSSNDSSPDSTTPSEIRDPRVNKEAETETKKRKLPEDDSFMIDRSGDNKIRRKMKESIKEEPISNDFKVPHTKDLDLRISQVKKEIKVEKTNEKSQNNVWTTDQLLKYIQEKGKTVQEQKVEPTPTIQTDATIATRLHTSQLPAPREPIWKIHIDGYPQFPQIGVDPRLLIKCPFYDPYRTITIDGNKYLLYLDRIQPCIYVNNVLHAVRFYCDVVDIHINGEPHELKCNEIAHVKINKRAFYICLGGPGHEIIINGWPYTVRIDGNVHQIKVNGLQWSVQIFTRRSMQVNVQNPIPPYICEWAVKGFFGSPQYLWMPVLNPLRNIKLQDIHANQFRNELYPMYAPITRYPNMGLLPPLSSKYHEQQNMQNETKSSNPVNDINVHDLFQKLIATGIISPNKIKDLNLDINKYSYDLFKVFNQKEIAEMYSGHQCDLCGTRFKSKESKEFELHLDYHFLKNTTHTTSNKVSRNYFSGVRQWLIGISARTVEPDFNFEQISGLEQKFKCPVFEDPEFNKCAVCLEKFEVEWDDEEERFMLQDGQLKDGKAYHPICLEDADKQLESQLSENADSTSETVDPVELTKQPHEALQKVLEGHISSVVVSDDNSVRNGNLEDSIGSYTLANQNKSDLLNTDDGPNRPETDLDYQSASNTNDTDDKNIDEHKE